MNCRTVPDFRSLYIFIPSQRELGAVIEKTKNIIGIFLKTNLSFK